MHCISVLLLKHDLSFVDKENLQLGEFDFFVFYWYAREGKISFLWNERFNIVLQVEIAISGKSCTSFIIMHIPQVRQNLINYLHKINKIIHYLKLLNILKTYFVLFSAWKAVLVGHMAAYNYCLRYLWCAILNTCTMKLTWNTRQITIRNSNQIDISVNQVPQISTRL